MDNFEDEGYRTVPRSVNTPFSNLFPMDNAGGVAKQNSRLSTYTPSADGVGKKDGSLLETCTKKE